MADSFGIPQIVGYLKQMGLRIAKIDEKQEMIELAFQSNQGKWRIIVGIQQHGSVRKMMLLAPHIGTITDVKRQQCLEALLSVNYRIAMGKFGLDMADGEVRLEEAVPLANDSITYEQFHLVFSAIMQTIAIYHNLLQRIVFGNMSIQEAIDACEQGFQQQVNPKATNGLPTQDRMEPPPQQMVKAPVEAETQPSLPELDVQDVLAEVARIFKEGK